jgi:hypothetical protein
MEVFPMRNLAAFSACLILAFGQDRPSLTGTWQFDAARSELRTSKMASATWVIEEGDNTIHITRDKKSELRCTTDGKECHVTGEKATASFWYNGPVLVEMETKGDHVTRYRIKLSDDGKTLTVELTHIVPQIDKIDTLVFGKQG